MQVIIVGCGKVGRTLAEQLQEEDDIDLTLIDTSAEKNCRYYGERGRAGNCGERSQHQCAHGGRRGCRGHSDCGDGLG